MKKILLTSSFILSYLFQLQAGIAPRAAKLTVIANEKSLVLNAASPLTETEMFRITDAFGKVVFTDQVEKNKQKIKYDLRKLPNGNYKITLGGRDIVSIYEAMITDEKVELTDDTSYYRPTIKNMDGKVLISAALENMEDFRISIYDNTDALVYRYKIEKEKSFSQVFNLEQLPAGEYNVIVNSNYFTEQSKITL